MEKASLTQVQDIVLKAWNKRDAAGMSILFVDDGICIGFDGTVIVGREQIKMEMQKIFDSHETGIYVWKVKEVRYPSEDCAVVQSVVGMIPPGKESINPALNAVQTMTAVPNKGSFRIVLLQNTPAQFHGRPELADALTKELEAVLD